MDCKAFQKFLTSSDTLHVYEANDIIFTSNKAGLLPLLEYINRFSSSHQRVTIIDKIMGNERKRPRDIRYIINCLFPGYGRLFERANKALLTIGEPAVKHLIQVYPYKSCNEFGDFTTCIYNLIKEIGGREAEEFLRSEQESQDNIYVPDSQEINEKGATRENI